MAWTGYAAMQRVIDKAGATPLKSFVGNTCVSAMNSFQTVGRFADCNGVAAAPIGSDKEHLETIPNDTLAPAPEGNPLLDVYYPRVDLGASRPATRCGDDPTKVNELDCGNVLLFPKCASNGFPPPLPSGSPLRDCMVTVLDHYTTSFNWADTNVAAVWLRQFWFVLSNSAITDVQNGGLTFVTGGDYTRSSVIDGVWSVAAKSAFVGRTQPDPSVDPNANPYAADVGPFNPKSGLQCPINDPTLNVLPNHCIEPESGINFNVSNFATNERLFNIYDGPSYQDSNAYLDIVPTKLPDLASQCQPTQSNSCPGAMKLYGRLGGMPKDATGTCYLPNASIGWKQPNGFFYPPAFHSQNLYFDNADIRHFVILPEFSPGTQDTDPTRVKGRYCTYPTPIDPAEGLFKGFTDVDRQTVLNDDDGSLTGLLANPGGVSGATRETISVNFDTYFDAPNEAPECGSDIASLVPPGTAQTEFAKAQQDFCQPASFCTLGTKGCECNPSSDFSKICEDNDLCAKWAGKDVDWPSGTSGTNPRGGAYAFGLKFPPACKSRGQPGCFVADDQDHRPAPPCLHQSDPGWNAPLIRAPNKDLLGDCATTPIPPAQFCAG
jgi:hypothetical protein